MRRGAPATGFKGKPQRTRELLGALKLSPGGSGFFGLNAKPYNPVV